jgi:inorganic pyrophosphatase
LQSELKNFFEEYKKLENKEVLVEGFQSAEIAKVIIQKAIDSYEIFKTTLGKGQ